MSFHWMCKKLLQKSRNRNKQSQGETNINQREREKQHRYQTITEWKAAARPLNEKQTLQTPKKVWLEAELEVQENKIEH